jgi:hypothetical protein
MNPLEQRHLDGVLRLRRVLHVGFGLGEQVEGSQQVFTREPRDERLEPLPVEFKDDFRIGEPCGVDRHQHHGAHETRELATQDAQIVAGFNGPAG